MANSTVWLSFDLGLRGDYDSLYTWLDEHDAKECGDGVAVFQFAHTGAVQEKLKGELKKALTVDKNTRVYAVYRELNTEKIKGAFLFGSRRAPPWAGYAPSDNATVDEDV